jgi:hypothetical protein
LTFYNAIGSAASPYCGMPVGDTANSNQSRAQ